MKSLLLTSTFFVAVLTLTGCASPTTPTSLAEIRVPDLKVETTAEIGDTLMRYSIATTMPSWQLVEPFNQLPAGYVLTPNTGNDVYESFTDMQLCRHRATGDWCMGQNAAGDCNAFACAMGGVSIKAMPALWVDDTTRPVDRQLIYNGRVEDSVRFTYREVTSGGIAREAFTQNAQYDLAQGNFISFKGARIEIIEATNQRITYRVLWHFPPTS